MNDLRRIVIVFTLGVFASSITGCNEEVDPEFEEFARVCAEVWKDIQEHRKLNEDSGQAPLPLPDGLAWEWNFRWVYCYCGDDQDERIPCDNAEGYLLERVIVEVE